jgi:hypothetical protein
LSQRRIKKSTRRRRRNPITATAIPTFTAVERPLEGVGAPLASEALAPDDCPVLVAVAVPAPPDDVVVVGVVSSTVYLRANQQGALYERT